MTSVGFNHDRTNFSGFACSCGEEGKARMAMVYDYLSEKFFGGKTPQPGRAVTQMLHLLQGYSAKVTGIDIDQWGRITTVTYDKTFSTHVEFDLFEDGLALTLRAYFKKFGPIDADAR